MCVESRHRLFICQGAPEADETIGPDENNAALRQPRLFREIAGVCPFDD